MEIFQFANRADPLANPKSVRVWLESLPAMDPIGALDRATALVGGPAALQSKMDVNRGRAILELDRRIAPPTEALRSGKPARTRPD